MKKKNFAAYLAVVLVNLLFTTACEDGSTMVGVDEDSIYPGTTDVRIEDAAYNAEFATRPFELYTVEQTVTADAVTYVDKRETKRETFERSLNLNVLFSAPEKVYVSTEAELGSVSLKASAHQPAVRDTTQQTFGCKLVRTKQDHTFRFDQNESVNALSVFEKLFQKEVYPFAEIRSVSYKDFESVLNEQLSNADSTVHMVTLLFDVDVVMNRDVKSRAVDADVETYTVKVPYSRIYKPSGHPGNDEFIKNIIIRVSDVLNGTNRVMSVTWAEIWSLSGQKNEQTETRSLPFGVTGPAAQSVYTTNIDYKTVSDGLTVMSQNALVDGHWTITNRVQEYSSSATNGVSPFTNPYLIQDNKVVFKVGEAEVEFPYGTWTVSEGSTTIGQPSDNGGYKVYPYVNNIDYIYAIPSEDTRGTAKAERTIYVGSGEKAKRVVIEYSDELVETGRKLSVTTAEIWSDGQKHNPLTETKVVPFGFNAPADQKIYTTDAKYTTVSKGLAAGSKNSKVDGHWNVTTRTQTYSSQATNGVSPFTNSYSISDCEVVYKMDEAEVTFPFGSWTVKELETTIGTPVTEGEYDVYPYVNKVGYVYAIKDDKAEGNAQANRSLYIGREVDEYVKTIVIGWTDEIVNGVREMSVTTAEIWSVSGQKNEVTEKHSEAYGVESPAFQKIYSKDANYQTTGNGLSGMRETNKVEGSWNVTTRNQQYSSTATNGYNPFNNVYKVNDVKVVYTKKEAVVEFPYGNWTISEGRSTVNGPSEEGEYEVYGYVNNIDYVYAITSGSARGTAKANASIYVKKQAKDEYVKTILVSKSDKIEGNDRVIRVTTAEIWSVSGQHNAETEELRRPIEWSNPSKQNIYTANVNYTTRANGWKSGSENSFKEGNFTVTTRKSSYSSTAANNDKNFNNVYSMSDSKVKYSKKEVSLDFGYGTWNVTEENSQVGSAVAEGEYNVYPYVNNVAYVYSLSNGESKNGKGTSEAKLYVEKPVERVIPESWGKIVGAGISAVPSDDLGESVNVAKKCLTIRTTKGAVAVVFDWNGTICGVNNIVNGNFVEGNFDASYNSGYWKSGAWNPAKAQDMSDRIAYFNGNNCVRNINFKTLKLWNWANGTSTVVKGYTFSVSDNGTLTVSYNGKTVLAIR